MVQWLFRCKKALWPVHLGLLWPPATTSIFRSLAGVSEGFSRGPCNWLQETLDVGKNSKDSKWSERIVFENYKIWIPKIGKNIYDMAKKTDMAKRLEKNQIGQPTVHLSPKVA
jgi:hypothetical protein